MRSTIFLLLFLLIVAPLSTEARHNSWAGVDRSDLDNDIVEEFPVPVLFGIEYEDITPDYGDPRGGGTRYHEGQDMLAPQGTPIVSPTEAIVIRTGTGESAGKYVYTANPGGETFRYMHLDYIADLDRGDTLEAGDFIGTVGDTGNAPDGVYHLHFEVRNSSGAQDPYPRLGGAFTLKQKVSFLTDIFRDIRDDEEYAEFLVAEFPEVFREALQRDYNLPEEIEDVLEEEGFVSAAKGRAQLELLLSTLPGLITTRLQNGSDGNAVVMLQLFIIYTQEGPARDTLAAAGPTGYFGPVTAAAVEEFQSANDIEVTGQFDPDTRRSMMRADINLRI